MDGPHFGVRICEMSSGGTGGKSVAHAVAVVMLLLLLRRRLPDGVGG